MRKIALLLVLLGLASSVHAVSNQIVWSNSVAIVDWTGALVPGDSTWIVRLYESTDSTINFNNMLPSGDDTYTGNQFTFGGSSLADGFGKVTISGPPNIASGDKIYSVIFNSSDISTATRWAVIDDAVATTSFPVFSYNPGGTVSGDWQAVPEPASALMLVFGAGIGLAAHRIRRTALRR